MTGMTSEQIAEAEAAIERANTEIGEICKRTGPGRWRMSIPANPDRDSDLIIAAALERGTALAAEVKRLQTAVRSVLDDVEHDIADAQAAYDRRVETLIDRNGSWSGRDRDIARFSALVERQTHIAASLRRALGAEVDATR